MQLSDLSELKAWPDELPCAELAMEEDRNTGDTLVTYAEGQSRAVRQRPNGLI